MDIYNTVKELRQRHVNMVANLEQYIFLHDALLEAVLCGETGVSAQELGEFLAERKLYQILKVERKAKLETCAGIFCSAECLIFAIYDVIMM